MELRILSQYRLDEPAATDENGQPVLQRSTRSNILDVEFSALNGDSRNYITGRIMLQSDEELNEEEVRKETIKYLQDNLK